MFSKIIAAMTLVVLVVSDQEYCGTNILKCASEIKTLQVTLDKCDEVEKFLTCTYDNRETNNCKAVYEGAWTASYTQDAYNKDNMKAFKNIYNDDCSKEVATTTPKDISDCQIQIMKCAYDFIDNTRSASAAVKLCTYADAFARCAYKETKCNDIKDVYPTDDKILQDMIKDTVEDLNVATNVCTLDFNGSGKSQAGLLTTAMTLVAALFTLKQYFF